MDSLTLLSIPVRPLEQLCSVIVQTKMRTFFIVPSSIRSLKESLRFNRFFFFSVVIEHLRKGRVLRKFYFQTFWRYLIDSFIKRRSY